MISKNFVMQWKPYAPWYEESQVEQDLVLSRAMVELFSDENLRGKLALRGGTALHKLHIPGFHRYSEDIDLVLLEPGPVGSLLTNIRKNLDPWLGAPHRAVRQHVRVTYRFQSEESIALRLKIEINTNENIAFFGHKKIMYDVENPWFSGQAEILTYSLEELLATKFRALYQRKKGRDLFDLWIAIQTCDVDINRVIDGFLKYISQENIRISRTEYENNLENKRIDPAFQQDILALLPPESSSYSVEEACHFIMEKLVSQIP